MTPGEEDEANLAEDVGVGDIEIVLERGDRDISIELGELKIISFIHAFISN